MKRLVLTSVLLFSVLALLTTFFAAGSAFATTYYVAANGSDSNNGTSQSAPWAHLPGMRTWTGNHSPVAGDTFILRGCDDWPNTSFPITWNWSGTNGSHITVDRDTSWYNTSTCPTGWNRPMFDAGGAVIDPPECVNNNAFWDFGSNAYIDVNWIELINYHWASPQANGTCFGNEFMVNALQTSAHIHLSNWYVHKWTVAAGADDIDHLFMEGCETCSVDYMVANNSDGTAYTGLGMQWPTQHSILAYVSNALKPNMSGEFGYNDISHVSDVIAGVHSNCIESIAPIRGSGNLYIHDNRIHDNPSCEGLQVGNPGESDYVWNNLWYNNTSVGANGPQIPQAYSNARAFYFFNNTNADNDTVCVRSGPPGSFWSSAFVMVNNHCITNGTPSGTSQSQGMMDTVISGAATILFAHNVVESASTASGQGYTNAQTYVYSPATATSPTVGAGQNLTISYLPAGYSSNDTTYACSQQTISGVVQSVCPARAPNARPAIGLWDVGAYQFGSAGSTGIPAPPTGLTAVAR